MFISGSASSTGSLSSAHIAQKVGIGTTGPGTVLPSGWSGNRLLEIRASSSGGDAGLFLRRFEGDGTYGMDFWTDTNSADNYIDSRGGISASELFIRVATHTSPINAARFDYLGNVEFPNATTISGSATSTGSFGRVHVTERIGVGNTDPLGNGNPSTAMVDIGNNQGGTLNLRDLNASGNTGFNQIFGGAGQMYLYAGGSSASSVMKFYTNDSERMRIDASGNVGIGKTNPSTKLDVTGTAAFSGIVTHSTTSNFVGNVGIGDIAGAAGGKLLFVDAADGTADNNDVARFRNQEATAGRNYGVSIIAGSNSTDNSLHVMDKSSNSSLIIKGDGNIGIGNTSPQFKVHISGSTDLLWLQGSGAPQLRMTDNSATSDGDTFALIDFAGMDHAGSSAVFNRISNVIVDNTQGTTDSRLGIHNHVAGTLTEVLSVASGKVGIGTTSPSANLAISGSGDSTSNELSIESDVYPILRFKSYGNNANNREFRFASVYNTYGKFEILSATNNTAAATTTRLSISGVTGDIEFPTANAKLSGSSSSTGSFARGHFHSIGINDTAPDYALDVTAGGSDTEMVAAFRGAQGGTLFIENTATGEVGFRVGSGDFITFNEGNDERVRIDGDGNVGIGTTAPGVAKLSVFDSTSGEPFLYVGDGTPNNDNSWDANIMLDSNQHSRIRIENRGNNKNMELYSHTGAEEPSIRATDSATKLRLGVGGTLPIEIIATGISGSAASTGSFGDGRFIGKVAIFGSGSKTPDTPLHIRGDFDGSGGLPNTNPNKGLNISKFTGLQSDYGKGDKFGITFTAASNAATDYALAGIYGQVTNVSSYVGGSLIFATRLETENALTAKMAISSSGNVGIGTTIPNRLLDVTPGSRTSTYSAADASTWADIVVRNKSGNQNTATGIAFYNNSSYHSNAGTGIAAVKAVDDGDYPSDLAFITRRDGATATEKMRITHDLKVGIGTNAPGATLDIGGGAVADPTVLIDSAAGGDPQLHFDTNAANRTGIIQFKDQGTVAGFINYVHNGDKMNFGAASSTSVRMAVSEPSIEFPTANVKVSGSATSTGSFGSLVVADAVQGNLHVEGGNVTIDSGNYLYFQDGNASIRRNSNDLQFHAYSGFIFSNNPGESFRVDNAGNLLIAAGNNITFAGAGNVSGSQYSTGSFGNVHVGKGGSSAQFANSKFSVVDNNSTEYAPMGGSSNTANAMVQFTNQNTSATAPHALIHFRLDKSGGDGYMGFMTSTSTGNVEHFVVGNQVDGELIRGASGGNVGIGDSNPSGKLVVSGSGTINLHIDNSGTGDTGLLGKRNATSIFGMFDDASDSKLRIVNYQAEPIEFSVDRGGSETIVMTMLNSGNVGIGGTTPGAKLEVYGDGTALNHIRLRHNGSGTNGVLDLSATSTNANIVANYSSTAIPLRFFTGAAERMQISATGNVGIGTTSPDQLLHIEGTAALSVLESTSANQNSEFQFKTTARTFGIGQNIGTTGKFEIYDRTAGATRVVVNSSGNVGIGNSAPTKTLTVNGEISSSLSSNNNVTFRSTSGGARVILDSTANETTTGIIFKEAGAQEASIVYDHSDDTLDFRGGGSDTTRVTIDGSGNVLPGADNSYNLGAADKRWANIFSADLQLSNEGTEGNEIDGTTGSWTIQEGEDDLYLLNRKNGKKYKFKLEEIT